MVLVLKGRDGVVERTLVGDADVLAARDAQLVDEREGHAAKHRQPTPPIGDQLVRTEDICGREMAAELIASGIDPANPPSPSFSINVPEVDQPKDPALDERSVALGATR